MSLSDKEFLQVLSEMESWSNYEITAKPRDLSKLDGIRLLLKDLGSPHKKFKIIHIAGTIGIAVIIDRIQIIPETKNRRTGSRR